MIASSPATLAISPKPMEARLLISTCGWKGDGHGLREGEALLHGVGALGDDTGQHHNDEGKDGNQNDGVAGAVRAPQIAVTVKEATLISAPRYQEEMDSRLLTNTQGITPASAPSSAPKKPRT